MSVEEVSTDSNFPKMPSDDQLKGSIKDILKSKDLSVLSSKKVRKMLEECYKIDLSLRKQNIDAMLMKCIDEHEKSTDLEGQKSSDKAKETIGLCDGENGPNSNENGQQKDSLPSDPNRSSADSDDSDPGVDFSPPRKKPRSNNTKRAKKVDECCDSDEDESANQCDDAKVARKLQEQDGYRMRSRSTKKVYQSKTKDSKARAKPAAGGGRKGTSVYSQECVLSDELAAVMGTDRMARKDVVSRMWQIFKDRQMMDPKNKQFVICDDQLETVFKTKRFKAFGMMKILKNHIKDAKLFIS